MAKKSSKPKENSIRFNSLEEMKELLKKGELRVVDVIAVSQQEYDWYTKKVKTKKSKTPTFEGYELVVRNFS